MAVTDKIRAWFQREHGYPLEDAFDVMEASRPPTNIDAENERLVNELAKKITPPQRGP